MYPKETNNSSLFRLVCLAVLVLFVSFPGLAQQRASQTFGLKNTKTLDAELQFNAGTFKLSTQELSQANMQVVCSKPAWKPQVKFNEQGGKATLSIKQPEEKNNSIKDNEKNEWDIKLPRAVLTNLKFRMGAGTGNLDLSGSKLNTLEIAAGAGEFKINVANTSVTKLDVSAGVGALTLNLTGARSRNLDADINGGIGDLTLVLPRKVGVRVKVSGLGGIENKGLRKQGGYYVNDAYGKSAQTLNITVSAGLGSIKMEVE